ncbi:aminoacyl-tRNA deacylase [Mesorhizobium sp. SP-1A]|uniref:aminoacyl-tRNA deacylase n=1 Tax=Mesorhizobium sp. SP-1A TaxID=3077840 RepID=UPI0028F6E6E4|nr:aminoacyl-tRNA deacylase [Mesorhizobium sp. SP-1A]
MTIARKLQDYLAGKGIRYETVAHHRTSTSSQTAQAAHVPGRRLAKSVLLHHETGYALAVVPSNHRVELGTLQEVIDRRLGLASEDEVGQLFSDCDVGAVPPVGAAYGVPVVLDDSFGAPGDVYFEGGDHKTLVHVSGGDFLDLLQGARMVRISHPA